MLKPDKIAEIIIKRMMYVDMIEEHGKSCYFCRNDVECLDMWLFRHDLVLMTEMLDKPENFVE
jgi:PP-loop superfamily ATP-utilizing enzyme